MTAVTDDGQEGTAISFDVSATGLLLAAAGKLDVGTHVTLKFTVNEGDEERSVTGRVVRVEPHAEAPWKHRMAIEFDEPHPELEGLLKSESDG